MAESSSAINRGRGSIQVTTGEERCDKAVVLADGGKGKWEQEEYGSKGDTGKRKGIQADR